MVLLKRILPIVWILASGFASATTVRFESFDRYEFSPTRKETIAIRFSIDGPAAVSIEILTPDGDPVRQLHGAGLLPAGGHEIVWDGRDDEGNVVPDEAYLPVLKVDFPSGTSIVIDSRNWSGGESVNKADSLRLDQGGIVFSLEKPTRILCRVGVQDGPMLNELTSWRPVSAGRVLIPWDGFDQDDLVNIRDSDRYSILLVGFELPQHTMIATGNEAMDYGEYRLQRGWRLPLRNPQKELMERNGQRISPHYYRARQLDKAPGTSLMLDGEDQLPSGEYLVDESALVRVDVDPDDKWTLNSVGYEVSFFVDGEFVAEEEQGYLPLSWKWSPEGLDPGHHVLSVNLVGFKGQMGVRSVPVVIE